MSGSNRTEAVGTGEPAEAEIRLLSAGSSLGERYEIRRVLGTGGYAAVYLAWDRELRREVALKVLRADRMSPNAMRRLRREAAIARDLQSPRLLRIHDIGQSDGAVYLTLEYVDGGSLRERIDGGPLPIEEVVRLAKQILEGLEALHRAGIVHRDIKPGNILLAADGAVKLGDFGLALQWDRQDTRLTVSETVVGTVDYIAPEQALGGEASPRSDLYAFGVVLFEMLSGELPFEADSRLGTMLKHIKHDAPEVRSRRKGVPAWLAAIVAELLARDPRQRPHSASEVRRELERRSLLANRGWRRRRAKQLVLAAALIALATMGGWWWLSTRPRFSQLATPDGRTLVALDQHGTTLWRLDGIEAVGAFAVAKLRPGETPRVVGVVRSSGDFSGSRAHRLSVLDGETGKVLDRVELPVISFPGFADEWNAEVHAVDLDGDGAEEVLIDYAHHTYWPSTTVLYEPRIQRARAIFAASGHHRFRGTADLDGDGRQDLLLVGPNNRMGYLNAVAAVRLDPPVNVTIASDVLGNHYGAISPGLEEGPVNRRSLLWYALIPRGNFESTLPCRFDFRNRVIELPFLKDTPRLGFDGFPAGEPGPPDRQEERIRAYDLLGEAQRFAVLGNTTLATERSQKAVQAAVRSGDSVLSGWSNLVLANSLVAGGGFDEAESIYRRALHDEADPSEVALTAARAFHLEGSLKAAERWYRVGLDEAGRSRIGRGRYELLEGLVFAALEAGDAGRVDADISRFIGAYPDQVTLPSALRVQLSWRQGSRHPGELAYDRADPDLQRVWSLEIAWINERDPEAFLARVDHELTISGATELVRSLRAEVLARLGRTAEALSDAGAAWAEILAAASHDIPSRAHLDLVGRRYEALLKSQGRAREAREVARTLAEWREDTRRASSV